MDAKKENSNIFRRNIVAILFATKQLCFKLLTFSCNLIELARYKNEQ